MGEGYDRFSHAARSSLARGCAFTIQYVQVSLLPNYYIR